MNYVHPYTGTDINIVNRQHTSAKQQSSELMTSNVSMQWTLKYNELLEYNNKYDENARWDIVRHLMANIAAMLKGYCCPISDGAIVKFSFL